MEIETDWNENQTSPSGETSRSGELVGQALDLYAGMTAMTLVHTPATTYGSQSHPWAESVNMVDMFLTYLPRRNK